MAMGCANGHFLYGEFSLQEKAACAEDADNTTTDYELWRQGVVQITRTVENLPAMVVAQAKSAIRELLDLKSAMHAVVEKSAGASICAACGGKCCRCGKYHLSAVDLVAYLMTGKDVFTPNFSGNGCLFLNLDSCLMSPEYRPFNCITFVCELLEDNFTGQDKDSFYSMERELRLLYQELQQIFPDQRMRKSVMSFNDAV